MINGADFRIPLNDGDHYPVLKFVVLSKDLHILEDTFLDGSTNLRGNNPPVRFRTYLSVT